MGFEARNPKQPPVDSKSKSESQSCPTLCDSMNYTVHGILQARTLEWVAVPFSRGSSQPRNGTQVPPRAVIFVFLFCIFEFCFPVLHYHSLRIFSDFSKADQLNSLLPELYASCLGNCGLVAVSPLPGVERINSWRSSRDTSRSDLGGRKTAICILR